jgi:phenylacetic acid degradation operon negative regulatory protein
MLYTLAAEHLDTAVGALLAHWRRAGRRGRLSQNLRNLEAAGVIARVGSGALDQRLYRITEQGRPEAHASRRAQIRRKLRELNFGWLQNSVWLTPDPVSQLVEQLKHERVAADSLLFLEGRPAGGETDAEIVAAAWDFAKLAKMHAAYLKIVRLRPAGGRTTKATEWAAWIAAEHRAWREILRHDPFLPEPLLPRDYVGRAVWQARDEALRACGRSLAEAAVTE